MSMDFLLKMHRSSARWLVILLAVAGLAAIAEEPPGNIAVRNFSAVLENYDAPYETQIKSLLEGTEAEPHGALILIRGLKWQTFATNGEVQMIVRSPQCIFDAKLRCVHSDGHIEAQSGDGRFYFEGRGFLLQLTNQNLIISNRVINVIRNESKTATKP